MIKNLAIFKKNSLMTRIATGKAVGFVVGLIGFIFLPYMDPEVSLMLRWGILLWYITLGAVIGVFGVFTYHSILKLPMPWYLMAPFIGAWMNFVLVLFAYDQLKTLDISIFGDTSLFVSPFWFCFEGAIIGLIIGWAATRLGGEGKQIVESRPSKRASKHARS